MRRSLAILLCLSLVSQATPAWALGISTPETDRPFMLSGLPDLKQSSNTLQKQENISQQSLVDLFNGAAVVSYPIQIPPGFDSATPTLSLDYSSLGDTTHTPYGFAWQSVLGKIERRTEPGPYTLYGRDAFRIETPVLQGDLILIDTNGTLETYGLEKESSFARIVRDVATNAWTVMTTDGVVRSFGITADARESNPGKAQTFNWQLEQTIDPHGNRIDYEYRRIGNTLYPAAIRYGSQSILEHPFSLIFEPFDQASPVPNRPRPQIDMRAGFERKYEHRVDAITIQIEGTERLRYDLSYSEATRTVRSNLIGITTVAPAAYNSPDRVTLFSYHRPEDRPTEAQRLLKSITYPTGGTFSLSYVNAKSLRKNGLAVNKRPHTRSIVVSQVTAEDPLGRQDTTTYFYEGGYFYIDNTLHRQVAGFALVTVTDPLGHKTEHYFHQGRSLPPQRFFSQDIRPLIGREYRTVQRDSQTGHSKTTHQEWKGTPLQSDRWFVYPELSADVFDDGTTTRSTATSRIYDPSFGNLTETIEYGEIELTADGFFDVLTDSRYQIVDYAHNASRHNHNRPSSESFYDHENNLVTRTVYQYDNLAEGMVDIGNKTDERRWLAEEARDVVTQYTHTPTGQVASILSARQGTTSLTYEPLGLYPHEITNPLQQTTTYDFDLLTGQAIRSTDPNGMTAQRTLDGHGRWILQEETSAQGTLQPRIRRTFEETTQPNALRTILLLDDGDQTETIEYLDGFGRAIQGRTQQAATDVYSVAETSYDALGRDESSSVSVFDTGSTYASLPVATPQTVTTYDAFDRVTQTSDANGTTTNNYQEAGSLKVVSDPNNHRTDYAYDAFDRLVGVTEINRDETYQTQYAYDVRDLLVGLQDAEGNLRSFEYDSLGRLLKLEDLHQADNASPPVWRFAYDDADNVIQSIDPRGQVVAANYDLLDRVEFKTFIDEALDQTQNSYEYDVGDYGIGRLTAIHTPDYSWGASYDVRGQVSQENVSLGGASFAKSTTYTDFDEPKTVAYPNGETITYVYNRVGQLAQVSAGSDTVVGPIRYTADSRIEQIDYGNGLVSSFTYDPAQMLRLTAKQTQGGGGLLQDLSYGYDPTGNIIQLIDQAPTAISRSLNYTYDDRDRLETATPVGETTTSYSYSPVGNILSIGNSNYQYATNVDDHPHAVQSIAGEGPASFTYDQSGNATQLRWAGDSYLLDWNVRNELVQTEHIANSRLSRTIYTYDDNGRRLRKINRAYQLPNCGYPTGSSPGQGSSSSYFARYGGYGTTIPWPTPNSQSSNSSSSAGGLPATCDPLLLGIQTTRYPFSDYQIDPSGDTRVAIAADQEHVATAVKHIPDNCGYSSDHAVCPPTRSIYYHHDDHLGGSSVVTDDTGSIAQLLDYEPFGSVKSEHQYATYDAVEKFTGYQLDDDTGLYYAGARYYHPVLARFTAIDPLQRKPTELLDRFGEDPQGLNAYSYANNNPLILVDPTGEFAIAAILAGVSAVAASYYFAPTDIAYAPEQAPNTSYNEGPSLAEGTLDSSLDEVGVPQSSAVRTALHIGVTAAGAVNAARSLRPMTTTKALGSYVKRRSEIEGTIDRISKGIRHRHRNDGGVFRNKPLFGRRPLPKKSDPNYYREYVDSPNLRERRPPSQRILTGKNGETYYSPDHYDSIIRINR